MEQKSFTFTTQFVHFLVVAMLFGLFFTSCGSQQSLLTQQEYNNYPGTIFLKDGGQKKGRVGMPTPDSKSILFMAGGSVADEQVATEKIDRIEFLLNSASNKVYTVRYLPVKGMFNKISHKWLMNIAEGTYVSAYIGAASYKINADGSIGLGGTRQVVHHGNSTMISNPSFPIYMKKKGDEALQQVALTKGISFEDSAFRTGISHFLSDDPKLTEHVRNEKWGFDELNIIVQNYIPNRGDAELVIDGVVIEPRKRSLFTADLNKELVFAVEGAFPSEDIYSMQFGIGIRSTLAKFFTYGVDLGYASAKYVDQTKRLENHGINNIGTAPVEDRDFSKQGLFRFNISAGGQLPFDLNKVYLIPGAHVAFGGMLGSDYSTLYYGPMATFDVGIKLGHGNILLIGAGYRQNIPLKGDEAKEEASAPGFEAYKSYGNLLFRLGYKF